jgi:hypothetical protein
MVDRHGKLLGGNNKGVRELESKEEADMLGHVQQSSGQGCRNLKSQDYLNF